MPALRYQTMGDLISDLQQIRREYESGQVSARQAGVGEPTVRRTEGSKRRPSRNGAE